jgi:hypothetical protein
MESVCGAFIFDSFSRSGPIELTQANSNKSEVHLQRRPMRTQVAAPLPSRQINGSITMSCGLGGRWADRELRFGRIVILQAHRHTEEPSLKVIRMRKSCLAQRRRRTSKMYLWNRKQTHKYRRTHRRIDDFILETFAFCVRPHGGESAQTMIKTTITNDTNQTNSIIPSNSSISDCIAARHKHTTRRQLYPTHKRHARRSLELGTIFFFRPKK